MNPSATSRHRARPATCAPGRAAEETAGPIRRGSIHTWILVILILGGIAATSPALSSPRDPSDAANASFEPRGPLVTQAPLPGESENGLPERSLPPSRADTINFGFYEVREDGLKYAVRDGKWTWDHGAADPLEGWTSVDLTANDREYWRHVTESIWNAEGNPLPWPQMNASPGIALCGATKGHADSLNWAGGVGYGNHWCQRLISPALI